jgi:hypothetical protein
MNYSNAFKRSLPLLLLPLVFFIFDKYLGSGKQPIELFIIAFTIFFLMALFFFLKSLKQRQIVRNGIEGIARIISVKDTGIQVNFKPQLHIKLTVYIPGKPSYEVVHKDSVDYWNMTKLQTGSELKVMVDKKNPEKLVIKW